ncbi:hypothetical protein [Amycolatopsis saalfeldensis]|uniref:hypothetical protein n=1 Tax=Amycolatopsis saalfeldensis TaxID=394193 RepID=UPI001FE7E4D9|nr:hypothetical protein [Amycolatopsis saalfeldensis]
MPRTPRPNAPEEERFREAGLRAEDEGLREEDDGREREPEPVDRGFAGVREPRAGAFPPLLELLRFLVADPAMPPR